MCHSQDWARSSFRSVISILVRVGGTDQLYPSDEKSSEDVKMQETTRGDPGHKGVETIVSSAPI